MTYRRNVQENEGVQRNMVCVCRRKFSNLPQKTGDWKIGVRPVFTKLWGERIVYAFVTLPKSGNGNHRLFFCTEKPENILLDYSKYEDNAMREYGEEKKQYLPLSCYLLHWRIETSYYESKTFWSFEKYRVWNCKGIERLINLECIAYSAMTLRFKQFLLMFLIIEETASRKKTKHILDAILHTLQGCFL